MNRYLIVIEETESGFSAYSPDLPGCIAIGSTRDEVRKEMRSAVAFHIEGLKLEGQSVPMLHSEAAYCEIT